MKRRLVVIGMLLLSCWFLMGPTCSDDDDDSSGGTAAAGCCKCVLADSGETILTDGVSGIVDCATVCTAYGEVSELDWQADACPAADDDAADDDAADDDDDDNDDNDTASGETWTDPTTGLTWQVQGSQISNSIPGYMIESYCEDLDIAGGGWRAPTISEMRTLVRGCAGTVTGGDCAITDEHTGSEYWSEACECAEGSGPNDGCYAPAELADVCYTFWSATPEENHPNDFLWVLDMRTGGVGFDTNAGAYPIRCVR